MLHRALLGGAPGEMDGLSGIAQLGSIGRFRAASPLPPFAQQIIDQAVIRVGRQRLVLVNDLLAEGLTRPLPNWMSVMEIGVDKVNDTGQAIRTMDLDVRGEREVQDRSRSIIPVFATHDDFSFGAREMAAAERVGQPLDTSHVEQATRNVNVAIEDQAINGIPFSVAGNSAPGILSNPANTYTYVAGKPWTDPTKTGAEMLADLQNMIAMAKLHGYYGPFNLYVPSAYASALNNNYVSGTTTFQETILIRLQQVQAGGRGIQIREVDLMPANRIALIQMTNNVIDVIVGQTPTEVSWTSGNGWRRYFVVLACMITRVKVDYNGGSGIVVGNIV